MAASKSSGAGRNSVLGPFLLAFLLVRLPLALVTRTPFQPDETWQSLEPAHARIFGYGHLTWEWRFNDPVEELGSWAWMSEGRLRGGGWVGVWAVVYWILQRLHLEEGLLVSPNLVKRYGRS
jgi:GPI mannosyltransferase 3